MGIDDLVDFCSETPKDIESEFQKIVDNYLAFCEEIGKEPQKEYRGMFNVRIPLELHRKLSLAAQSEGVGGRTGYIFLCLSKKMRESLVNRRLPHFF